MKRIIILLLFISLLSCSTEKDGKTVVKGKIELADGGGAKKEVYLYYPAFRNSEDNLASVTPVNDDGTFELEIPDGLNYAMIHCAAVGYRSFETHYVAGDKAPKIEAKLFRRPIALKPDSARAMVITENEIKSHKMEKISETQFSIELEDTFEQDSIGLQAFFTGDWAFYISGLESSAKYDHGGDYMNIVYPENGKYKITIDTKNYRQEEDIATAEQSSGKWVDAPAITQYNDIFKVVPEEEIQYVAPEYYYFVKRGAPRMLEGWSEEEIEKKGNSVLKAINDNLKRIDSLLGVTDNEYIRSYLVSQKFDILAAPDSLEDSDLIAQLDTIAEIHTNFYNVYNRLIYSDLYKENPDSVIVLLQSVFERSKNERNRDYLNFGLAAELAQSDFIEDEDNAQMVIDTIHRILEKGKPASWAKESGKKYIKEIKMRQVKEAPDFAFTDIVSGEEKKISDFRGKWILLDFWGTWCGPCRGETPFLVDAYEKFKGDNFEIISVSTDPAVETVTKYMDEKGMKWVNTIMLDDYCKDAVEKYGVTKYPTLYLINPEGQIDRSVKEYQLRGEDLEKTLSNILASAY